jgi:hypothetical protein
MKTLGRILIILVVFALIMGLTYVAVNAAGNSLAGAPRFENGERPSPPDGQFQPGQRPEGFEERERDEGGSLFGLMGGFVKNIVIISMVVVLIAVPRSLMRNRKRAASVATE